jgi:polysaccharide export outer membrane protein
MKKSLLLVGILFLLNSCVGNQNYSLLQTKQQDMNVSVSDRSMEYRILAQDRLAISLYKDPSQSSELGMSSGGELGQVMNKNGILVDTVGTISLPLVGKVKVTGLTQTQAANRITQAYKKYLNTPTVYVEVLNKRIFVLGEVRKPGVINIDKEKMTLFEALATAGDLTDSAVRTEIIILSNNKDKGMQLRKVDLTNFDKMNYASLMLRPNDIVYVKPNKWKQFKVNAGDLSSPFGIIATIAAPFVTLKYLGN